ncbi:ArnT family glycosyltransferase [Leptolyngbya sp. BL0902]|uniref:ArnT family glycosyltransferase n=1 Tax=Leptolyngbya sp. BL0902 TaxID=1115757 RepID=UPI0018E884CC|nr:glycosyltransferase family 39 protein [Leptolyngbya sp. BL0902]
MASLDPKSSQLSQFQAGMEDWFRSPVWRWGRWWLLAFLVVRIGFWGAAFPNPDEAYYWLWGQRPSFSYYDHPPFHAWIQGLSATLLGRSTWALRLPNLVSNGILAVTFYRIGRYLYGDDGGDRLWLMILLLAASPLFFLFLSMAWHDHWLVTLAVLSSFDFVRFVDSYQADGRGQSRHLYRAALFLGLAGLSKYNALFVGLGFLATLLTQRSLRRLLLDARLYIALGITLLTLSPILIWNWQQGFASFQFYGDRTSGGDGLTLNLLQPLVFLLLCGLILGPIHTWGLWRLGRRWPRVSQNFVRPSLYPVVAGWMFVLSTGTFVALSLVSVALYYWNILAYPLLLPLLADRFYRQDLQPGQNQDEPSHGEISYGKTRFQQRGQDSPPPMRHPRQMAVAQGLGLFAVTVLTFHYTVIPITALFGPADNDSAALFGWDQIAAAVTVQAETLENPLLLTTDYRSAGALAYQLDNPDVLAISGRIDQTDFWYDVEALDGRDAVLLGEDWHPICPAHLAMFERTDLPQIVTIQRLGRPIQTYHLVTGYGFRAREIGSPLDPAYPLAFTTDGERCEPDVP